MTEKINLPTIPENSCSCNKCKRACQTRVGWFAPGEPEKVAQYLNTTLEELFKTRLVVDYYHVGENFDVPQFLLAPAVVGGRAGAEESCVPGGTCTFYKDGACSIYPVRPYECRDYLHGPHDRVSSHADVAAAWQNDVSMKQIVDLLGRVPATVRDEGAMRAQMLATPAENFAKFVFNVGLQAGGEVLAFLGDVRKINEVTEAMKAILPLMQQD